MLRLVVLSCALLAAIGCGSDGGVELNEEALMEPTSDEMKTEAPEQYAVTFETTAGNFVLTVYRDWAPRGADRAREMRPGRHETRARTLGSLRDASLGRLVRSPGSIFRRPGQQGLDLAVAGHGDAGRCARAEKRSSTPGVSR